MIKRTIKHSTVKSSITVEQARAAIRRVRESRTGRVVVGKKAARRTTRSNAAPTIRESATNR